MRWMSLSVLILIMFQNICFSENKGSISIANRLNTLEENAIKQTENLENYKKENAKSNEQFKKDIELELKAFKQENNLFVKTGLWLGISSILGLIFLAFGFIRFIDKKMKELFEKKLHDHQKSLLTMIENKDREMKMKRSKSILVISSNEQNKNMIRKLLVSSLFENVSYIDIKNVASASNADITLINDSNNSISDNQNIIDLINKDVPGKMVFYFGSKTIDPVKIDKEMASARFPSQIYGNLMSALYYITSIADD